MRKPGVVPIRERELRVLREQVVKVSRSASPVPENEQGWLDIGVLYRAPMSPLFRPAIERVRQTRSRCNNDSWPVYRVNSEPVLQEKSDPVAKTYACNRKRRKEPLPHENHELLGRAARHKTTSNILEHRPRSASHGLKTATRTETRSVILPSCLILSRSSARDRKARLVVVERYIEYELWRPFKLQLARLDILEES